MYFRNLLFVVPLVFAGSASAQEECSTVAECAQKAVEAAFQAKLALQIAVPKGAVMAFNLSECPEGWTPFAQANGRVVVGSGQGSGLTARTLGQVGGAETHTLTVDEMPAHSHTGEVGTVGYRAGMNNGDRFHNGEANPIGSTGGGKAHNNMQPYFVLTYCERK